ncbi:type I methionyl aminopeptidase [Micromonospora fluostatini]|uniref:Methionine aminopeptidase n=2 Tax=Micromonospora TaxID=1873 RepID=A0A136PYU2_9ACTN|nr:type I methionyl aminopeptidase [Micromonospora rosaria]KXK63612.1 methionine aminopeptidase [Micromonospora rosaria]TDB97562.1 type I methionyl aminopeptidase [Micromonospora fluostatini]
MRRHQLDIQLKTPEQVEKMRAAGLVVAEALRRMREAVAPGVSTADLDAIAESTIREAGATPSFKGYHGFPASICSSVNEQIVHAIPAPDQVLREGDLISIDCGAVLDGWHGDAAITVGVGEVDPALLRMASVAEDAMWAGIAAAARGAASGRGRLTDISYAVETAVRKGGRYGIVDGYGGHGIGTEMHQDPHVLNHGRPGKGPRLVAGMALAIEPMITMGSPRTEELADGWTVVTRDGSVAAHVEHSMALLPDGVWVLTAVDGGRARLGDLVTARQPVDTPAT